MPIYLEHLTPRQIAQHIVSSVLDAVGELDRSADVREQQMRLEDAVIEAIKKLGFNPADDNEADALALLNLVIKEHEGGSL